MAGLTMVTRSSKMSCESVFTILSIYPTKSISSMISWCHSRFSPATHFAGVGQFSDLENHYDS
jgi:hypothetical protein